MNLRRSLFVKQLSVGALINSLVAIIICYASYIFYFEPKANPAFGLIYMTVIAVIFGVLFPSMTYAFVARISRQSKLSLWQSVIVWLVSIIVSFAFFFAIDFLLNLILPALGQSLTYKLDDYKLMKNRPANSELLPIGWQGFYFQMAFLPFGTLLVLFAKLIAIGIKGVYRTAFGK